MAYPPSQSLSVRNNGISRTTLGAVYPLVIGYTSGGSDGTFGVYTDPQELKDDHGHGVGVELGLSAIAVAGGVCLLRPTHTTAGAASAVTATRIDSSVGTVTVAGTPYLPFDVIVEITETTSALGSGRFKVSLDSGKTYTGEKTIPAGGTYAIPGTGLTLTFTLNTGEPDFEEGDLFTFTCTAPQYTTSDLSSAVTVLWDELGTRRFRRAFFGGQSASASAAATMAAAIATHMATADSLTYFARALMSAGTDTAANVQASLVAAFEDDRVGVCHSICEYLVRDSFEGWSNPRVPTLWPVAERAMGTALSENLGRKASGSLRGVTKIRADDGSWGHDEDVSTAFTEDDRIITLRSYRGESGYYVTNGFLRSASSSDFKYFDWGTVIDAACEIVQREQDKLILSKARTLRDGTGRIDPRDAKRIENNVRGALNEALKKGQNPEPGIEGHVSDITYNVDLTNDFLTTRQLVSSFGAIPLVPIEGIATEGGFVRSF